MPNSVFTGPGQPANINAVVSGNTQWLAVGVGATPNIMNTAAPWNFITQYSVSARNSFEQAIGTDTDGQTIGNYVWTNALQSTSDKRVAEIRGFVSGATALNRGGRITFSTRVNNGSAVAQAGEINNLQAWGFGTSAATDAQVTIGNDSALTFHLKIAGTTPILRFSGAGGSISFNTGPILRATADGRLIMTNQAADNFDRLQFGGTTSSFPSLKRSTTVLECRLADDSNYAGFTASGYNAGATAGVTAGPFTAVLSIRTVGGIVTVLTGT